MQSSSAKAYEATEWLKSRSISCSTFNLHTLSRQGLYYHRIFPFLLLTCLGVISFHKGDRLHRQVPAKYSHVHLSIHQLLLYKSVHLDAAHESA